MKGLTGLTSVRASQAKTEEAQVRSGGEGGDAWQEDGRRCWRKT